MPTRKKVREPRWPAFVAMIAASVLYWALPEPTSLGPSWSLSVIIVVLLVPIVVSSRVERFDIARNLTFIANGAITIGLVGSLIFMIEGIPKHRDTPQTLLRSAIALWITNILVFNTSTAFSPTDTAVLSRWAKVGMMVQSLISLAIVVLIAARAVNIL